MYKMLLVEDKAIEREGLRDLVDWASLGIEVIAFAESAEEALDISQKKQLDILFTDIQLLEMSGLELAKKLLESNRDMKVIINSGFEEFEYAREAVEIHAWSFLSKPIDMKKLKETITGIVAKCDDEQRERTEKNRMKLLIDRNLPLIRDRFFTNLVMGRVSGQEILENLEHFNIDFIAGEFTIVLFEIDNFKFLIEGRKWDEIQLINIKAQDCIESTGNNYFIYTFYISEGRFCSIVNTPDKNSNTFHKDIMNALESIRKKANKLYGYNITIGIGSKVNKLNKIKTSYTQALSALKYKFFMGNNQIISYKDVHYEYYDNKSEMLDDIQTRILSSIELCNSDDLTASVDSMFNLIKMKRYADSHVRSICYNLVSRMSVMLYDLNESLGSIFGSEDKIWLKLLKYNTIIDIKQWILNICMGTIEKLSHRKKNQNRNIIRKILEYIKKNYDSNINISDISNEVYLSPNYISLIFKKETGKRFTDYLINFRLEKARELLKDPSARVYEVANSVGYTNISYFCSIFKKMYGVSPNEYKEKS